MARVRSERDRFVGFVKDAVDGFDTGELIRQNAKFLDDTTLVLDDGSKLTARTVIIATGSRPAVPPPLMAAGDKLIINDDVFDWQNLPSSVAVFGAGVIGLELGQALSRLGVRVHLFGLGNSVGPLSDPDLVSYARNTFSAEFGAHFDADTEISLDGDEVIVKWTNRGDQNDTGEERFEYLLAATGRRPNLDLIGLENTSLELDDRGTPQIDRLSMRAASSKDPQSSIFVTGDAAVEPDCRRERGSLSGLIAQGSANRTWRGFLRSSDCDCWPRS
jgi:dihydrolipoamide dehydrogenase